MAKGIEVRLVCAVFALLVIVIALPIKAFAYLSNNESETNLNGYLVKAEIDTTSTDSTLRHIAADVYYTEDETTAYKMLQNGYAEYVEPDYAVSLFSLENDMSWSYEMAGGADAESLNLSGDGVRIAVIDSGVDVNNINLTGASIDVGYDYLDQIPEGRTDTVGHGTYVSQIIAGSGELGVVGFARKAELVPLRCFSATKGSVSDIIAAIYDAVNVYHCDIINMSWGMKEDSAFLLEALEYAFNSGVILVAAAGNVDRNTPQGTIFYPAAYPEVIGVGSVDSSQTISETSQHTDAVFVSAPGAGISLTSLSGKLTVQSGTSFATPYITAELALLKQLNSSIDGRAAISLLRERSIDLGDEGYDTSYGHGLATITQLVGQMWYAIEKNDTLWKLTGWFRNENGSYVIPALYDSSGKMLECYLSGSELSLNRFEFKFGTDIESFKLFIVNHDFVPLVGYMEIDLKL